MLDIQNLHNKKGLASKEDSGIIPLGKKGDIITYSTSMSDVILDYGATINDNDRRNALTCISLMLDRLGFDQLNALIQRPLNLFNEQGQVVYTTFSVNAAALSKKLYGSNREARLITKSLKKVSHLQIEINMKEVAGQNIFNQMQNISYKNGSITFDIANILVQHLAKTKIPFRLDNTLLHMGFDYRLSFYVETHQYSKDGVNWYPRQTYKLDDLIDGLYLRGTYENKDSKYIKKIQSAFDSIRSKDNKFPKYQYNPTKKWFYNKYLKGSDKTIFLEDVLCEVKEKKEDDSGLF